MTKRIICKQCGSVNIAGQISEGEDIISCELPEGLDWGLPMGQIKSDGGEIMYLNQQGKQMTKEQYIQIYHIDPAIAHEKMKHHIGVYVGD